MIFGNIESLFDGLRPSRRSGVRGREDIHHGQEHTLLGQEHILFGQDHILLGQENIILGRAHIFFCQEEAQHRYVFVKTVF